MMVVFHGRGCVYTEIQFIQFNYVLLKQNTFVFDLCLVLGFIYYFQVRNVPLQYLTVTFECPK